MIKGNFWVDENGVWYARIYYDAPGGHSYIQEANSLPEALALLAVNITGHLDKLTNEYLLSTWGLEKAGFTYPQPSGDLNIAKT